MTSEASATVAVCVAEAADAEKLSGVKLDDIGQQSAKHDVVAGVLPHPGIVTFRFFSNGDLSLVE